MPDLPGHGVPFAGDGAGAGVTRLIIAPEPAAWLQVRAGDLVVAPWAKTMPEGVRLLRVPGWRWLRGAAARVGEPLAVKLMVRRALDVVVSTLALPFVTEVVAPSLAARCTFARWPKAARVLMVDLPQLLQLQEDLDVAARALPMCSYLRHYRASQAILVQQAEEQHLASQVQVRSRFAQQVLRRSGVASVAMATMAAPAVSVEHDPSSRRVLLAGSTSSRSGLEVALEAISHHPGHVVLAREVAGSQPSSLRSLQLRVLRGSERCPSVCAVWAPSWVEQVLPEVTRAAMPVVATERALGWAEPGGLIRVMQPGAVTELRRSLVASL